MVPIWLLPAQIPGEALVNHAVKITLAPAIVITVVLISSGYPVVSHAEYSFAFYGGASASRDSDVHLQQAGGTDLEFHGVSWRDRSFKLPIYYGMRLTRWSQNSPNWGLALDFTHAKVYAKLNETVRVSGTRQGNPVNANERPDDTFDELSMSHGHNLLTLNALYRWHPADQCLHPYAGIGAGIAIPHVEVITSGISNDEYQIAGPAFNVMAGMLYKISDRVAAFAEYKWSYADIDADLQAGGSLETTVRTNHYDIGVDFIF